MSEPEPTERPAETIQRKFRLPLAPVGTLVPAGKSSGYVPTGEQKAIGQRDEQEQLAAWLPAAQSHGLDGEFGFLETKLLFHFPAGDRPESAVPNLLLGLHCRLFSATSLIGVGEPIFRGSPDLQFFPTPG